MVSSSVKRSLHLAFIPPASGSSEADQAAHEKATQSRREGEAGASKTRGYSPWYLSLSSPIKNLEDAGHSTQKNPYPSETWLLRESPSSKTPLEKPTCVIHKGKKIKCKTSFPGVLPAPPEDGILPRSMRTHHKEGA